jgi:hypothetical protein
MTETTLKNDAIANLPDEVKRLLVQGHAVIAAREEVERKRQQEEQAEQERVEALRTQAWEAWKSEHLPACLSEFATLGRDNDRSDNYLLTLSLPGLVNVTANLTYRHPAGQYAAREETPGTFHQLHHRYSAEPAWSVPTFVKRYGEESMYVSSHNCDPHELTVLVEALVLARKEYLARNVLLLECERENSEREASRERRAAAPKVPTIEERLVAALRDLIRDMLPETE